VAGVRECSDTGERLGASVAQEFLFRKLTKLKKTK
jgi:hypothetical protein